MADGTSRDLGTLKDQWSSLPAWQRTGTIVLGTIEIVATTVAVVDLIRRPRAEVRGPKAVWWPALTVQPLGPFAYLALGRRRPRAVKN